MPGPTGLKIGQESYEESAELQRNARMDDMRFATEVFINAHNNKYYFTQRNGQRIFGPVRHNTPPEPDISCEVFIGKLPRFIFEDTLVPLLLKVGEFYNLRILLDFDGGNRGFAFVRFFDRRTASAAASMFNHLEITPGDYLGCMLARNNNEILIGNLSYRVHPSQVYCDLMQMSHIIKEIRFLPYDSKGRYSVIIEFKSHRDAALSRRILIAHRYEHWRGQTIVDWASKHIYQTSAEPACVFQFYGDQVFFTQKGITKRYSQEECNKYCLNQGKIGF